MFNVSTARLLQKKHRSCNDSHRDKQHEFQCQDCLKTFGSEKSLRSHIDLCHSGKKLVCLHCGNRFKRKDHLGRHVSSVHDKIRKYECPTCHSLFSRKTNLDDHVAEVHEGLKPFQCRLCDKSFRRKRNLKRHVRCCHKKGSEEQESPEDGHSN